ncbi:rod shape-determining protein MreD [Patescibacteria group bacterium]|nr:rod shape-determining protein MreD [Patescibacteria group bacterium]
MEGDSIKKYLILIFLFSFLLLLQESFFSKIFIFDYFFNPFLIPIFLLIIFSQKNLAFFSAFFAGFLFDLFSFLPFGIFIFSLCLNVFLTDKLFQIFQKANFLTPIFLFALFLVSDKFLLIFGKFLFGFLFSH